MKVYGSAGCKVSARTPGTDGLNGLDAGSRRSDTTSAGLNANGEGSSVAPRPNVSIYSPCIDTLE